jgi:hypothetical protein
VPGGTGGARVPVDLGALATLTVPTPGTARLDGIPLGAQCDFVESGVLGDFGEVRRDPTGPQQVDILVAGSAGDPVPAAQLVTMDNHYAPLLPGTGGLASSGVDGAGVVWLVGLGLLGLGGGVALVAFARRRRASAE